MVLNIHVQPIPTIILHECTSAQSRVEESELLYLKALAIRERALGKEHPSIQGMREQYTILLQKMKKE